MNKNNKFIFFFLFIHTHIYVFFLFFFYFLGWAGLGPASLYFWAGPSSAHVGWAKSCTREVTSRVLHCAKVIKLPSHSVYKHNMQRMKGERKERTCFGRRRCLQRWWILAYCSPLSSFYVRLSACSFCFFQRLLKPRRWWRGWPAANWPAGNLFWFWVFVVCRDEGNGRANTRLCVLLLSCSLRLSVYYFFLWIYALFFLCSFLWFLVFRLGLASLFFFLLLARSPLLSLYRASGSLGGCNGWPPKCSVTDAFNEENVRVGCQRTKRLCL